MQRVFIVTDHPFRHPRQPVSLIKKKTLCKHNLYSTVTHFATFKKSKSIRYFVDFALSKDSNTLFLCANESQTKMINRDYWAKVVVAPFIKNLLKLDTLA